MQPINVLLTVYNRSTMTLIFALRTVLLFTVYRNLHGSIRVPELLVSCHLKNMAVKSSCTTTEHVAFRVNNQMHQQRRREKWYTGVGQEGKGE